MKYLTSQLSGEAVEGYIAFLKGKKFEDNPYTNTNKEVPYKNWCDGFRNGREASESDIKIFKWIYSIHC
jgi:ribosome modulation factor